MPTLAINWGTGDLSFNLAYFELFKYYSNNSGVILLVKLDGYVQFGSESIQSKCII